MRGNADAVASAYSLDDYRIADDLGGDEAYANLRDRAWARGIRLASDMVPNHMGIDSRWVIEHPEWFLSLPSRPIRSTRSRGRTCRPTSGSGSCSRTTTGTTATRRSSSSASTARPATSATSITATTGRASRGTTPPSSTSSTPAVREQVIRTILDVARQFPIIRFDAAMVLAKKHIQRLWWPEPGSPGGVPSRAEHAIPKEEFDRRMPVEFWREVVDRVAAEVPDTLLLAEAFWLLEGYFVRTLGMHRVYNSAFMHMLRDEDGAGYRKVIKDTIEFDPAILQRYVNFMSNPDEKTAIEQFGKGDKYFGVATVLATLPGLPMLGHGQVQGFGEKYGMEFRRAMLDERPDPGLVERHEREIFPLFHRRAWFAESDNFLLYDLRDRRRRRGRERPGLFERARPRALAGALPHPVRVHDGAGSANRRPTRARRRTARGGSSAGRSPTAWSCRTTRGRSSPSARRVRGSSTCARAASSGSTGSTCRSAPTAAHVYWEFREVWDGAAGQWARLAARLGGTGVPSLDDALRELQLEPVHGPLRALFAGGLVIRRHRRNRHRIGARRARAPVRGVPDGRRRSDGSRR